MQVERAYIVVWHSGDSSHCYNTPSEAIAALRYFPEKDATLRIIDNRTGKQIEELDCPAAR